MEKLISTAPSSTKVPVIDLGGAEGGDHTYIAQQIIKASQEFGCFQVINHGISKTLLSDTMAVFKEFFELPAEDKASLYSEDPNKSCKLHTIRGNNYDEDEVHIWREALHLFHPLEEGIEHWPQKPSRYRELVGTCSTQVWKQALNILELISEGLELGTGYFQGDLSKGLSLSVNHYPPCPNPSLTLRMSKHCDPNLLTIIMQEDHVNGLQVFKDGEWIGVEPVPRALVVFIDYQLQIVSNGKLKSAEHKVVTNSSIARISVAFFIAPSDDCVVEPAKVLVNESNPRLYKGFLYKEFFLNYMNDKFNGDVALKPFKL